MASKDYFEKVAGQWDQMRQGFFSEAVRDKALEAGAVKPGALAADIGAGTGFITEALLQKGLRVIAVDQSPEMLGQIKNKFSPEAALDCRQGDDASLPLTDAEVDYAFANMYLHHVESPTAALKEMARILKPGGTLVITDLDEHQHEFLREEQHDRWLGFKREHIQTWLQEAGLEQVSVDCVGQNCCADSQCGCDQASISIFVAQGQKPLSEAARVDSIEQAADLFGQGFVCSQAILAGFGREFGLEPSLGLRLGRAFGGGAGMGLPCGAVLGAMLVMGLKEKQIEANDRKARMEVYEKVREFCRRFERRNGSIWCTDLLGVDLGTETGRKEAAEKDLFLTHCPGFVKDAGQILKELI
jgi:C_GCAxxG_C_C family probable redox protein